MIRLAVHYWAVLLWLPLVACVTMGSGYQEKREPLIEQCKISVINARDIPYGNIRFLI